MTGKNKLEEGMNPLILDNRQKVISEIKQSSIK